MKMGMLTDWITNIIIFILLATVVDMLLPSSVFKKYAKMVLGLLLIAIMITPFLRLISSDFDRMLASVMSEEYVENGQMETAIEQKKKEIQASQDAYILEEMAVQLKKDGEEELIKEFNYEIKHLDLSLTSFEEGQPEKITVTLVPAEQDTESVQTVKMIDIDTQKEHVGKQDQHKEIARFLAEKWEVDEAIIEVGFERRDAAR